MTRHVPAETYPNHQSRLSDTMPLAAHSTHLSGMDHPIFVTPAERISVGMAEFDDGEIITILVVKADAPDALAMTFSPDEARTHAAALVEMADTIERHAADAANEAIRRAGRRP